LGVSRPQNPDWTVLPFAPDANYPVGALPWSGGPTKVVWAGAASVGFEPKNGVPAQCINDLFNKTFDLHTKVKDTLTELIGYTCQDALNVVADSGAEFSTTARAAYFDPLSKSWYVCGTSGLAKASSDMGRTWRDVLLGETKSLNGIAVNNDGVVVYCSSGRYVQVAKDMAQTNPLTGEYDCFGVLPGNVASAIVFATTPALFCCVSDSAASPTLRIRTSPDGNTWTAQANPAGWVNGDPRLFIKPNGRIIMVALSYSDHVTVAVSYSDDGGVTWSAATTYSLPLVTGVSQYDAIYLGYDASKDRFLLVGSVNATTDGVQAKSVHCASTDDGATWTQVGTGLVNSGIKKPACIGGLWVATLHEELASVHDIRSSLVYSLDDGATWQRDGYFFFIAGTEPGIDMVAADVGVWDGAGGLLILTSLRAYLTVRQGDRGLGNAT
jgi:hypothetical protein